MEHNNASPFPPLPPSPSWFYGRRRRRRRRGGGAKAARSLTHSLTRVLWSADLDCGGRREEREGVPRGFFEEQTRKVGEGQKRARENFVSVIPTLKRG